MPTWSRSTVPFPALDLIRATRPFQGAAYQHPDGGWRIGHGSQVMPNGLAVDEKSSPISPSQAENLLQSEMPALLKAVAEVVWIRADEAWIAALVSLAADAGAGVLHHSALLNMLNAGRPDLAAGQFARWVMVPDPDNAGRTLASPLLAHRRFVEAAVFGGAGVEAAVAAANAETLEERLAAKMRGDADAAQWMVPAPPGAITT